MSWSLNAFLDSSVADYIIPPKFGFFDELKIKETKENEQNP